MDQNKIKTVAAIEHALVDEFRLFQSLADLSRQELDALTRRDVDSLTSLVEKKEAILDELSQIEDDRRLVVEDLAEILGLDNYMPTIADLLPYLDRVTYERLKRIQEGILALGVEIRTLNRSNYALAKTALDWADATQAYLLSLNQPEFENYQVPGAPKRQNAVRSFDQWA